MGLLYNLIGRYHYWSNGVMYAGGLTSRIYINGSVTTKDGRREVLRPT